MTKKSCSSAVRTAAAAAAAAAATTFTALFAATSPVGSSSFVVVPRRPATLPAAAHSQRQSRQLQMASSGGMEELANNALRQSPSTTRFYTHKMCPYAQKVWLALEAGNCPYEMQQIDLYGGGGKPEWFLDLNPAGEVPVVTCFGGAKILIDSEYILTRLAEGVVEGGQALGGDGSEAMNDRMERWRDDMNTQVKKVGKQAVLRGGKHVDELMELLKSLDGNVVGPYLCGDAVTVADCSAFPFLWRLDSEFGPLTKDNGCGNIRAWLDTCGETEAFKKTIQSAWWWWW